MNEFKGQAQEYGQKFQDAAMKAKDFASEKYAVANEKFNELKNKEPQELVEERERICASKTRAGTVDFGGGGFGHRTAFKRRSPLNKFTGKNKKGESNIRFAFLTYLYVLKSSLSVNQTPRVIAEKHVNFLRFD